MQGSGRKHMLSIFLMLKFKVRHRYSVYVHFPNLAMLTFVYLLYILDCDREQLRQLTEKKQFPMLYQQNSWMVVYDTVSFV